MNKTVFAVLTLLFVSSAFAYPTVQVLEKETKTTYTYKPVYTTSSVSISYDAYQDAYMRGYDDGKHHRTIYRDSCYDPQRTYVSCTQRSHTYKYTPFVYWSTA